MKGWGGNVRPTSLHWYISWWLQFQEVPLSTMKFNNGRIFDGFKWEKERETAIQLSQRSCMLSWDPEPRIHSTSLKHLRLYIGGPCSNNDTIWTTPKQMKDDKRIVKRLKKKIQFNQCLFLMLTCSLIFKLVIKFTTTTVPGLQIMAKDNKVGNALVKWQSGSII